VVVVPLYGLAGPDCITPGAVIASRACRCAGAGVCATFAEA